MDTGIHQPLRGQVAIVTGGSSGIGAGIVEAMAAAGAAVTVNYYSDEESANALVKTIHENGGQALAAQGDVSQEDDVKEIFSRTLETFGSLDIVVCNAGIQKDAPLTEMTLKDWNKVIDINLTGQFLCAREAAKEFLRQGVRPEISCAAGKIICMSSVHEVIPWAGRINYAASKGGVNMLMQTLAQELAPHKIRANSIAPGAIKTPINRAAWETPAAREELLKLIPSKRIGTPEDIAKATVWLASDASDYVNGTTLFIDGGMTLYPGFATGGG